MTHPMNDLLVVVPGIMGSALARHGEPVWSMSARPLFKAIRTLGGSINDLRLDEGIGDDAPDDGVVATGLLTNLHVLPGIWSANVGYDGLLAWLRSTFHLVEAHQDDPDRAANFIQFPYDWRLSNRLNGRRLKAVVEPALEKWRGFHPDQKDAKVSFICHSMGGLVARWYADCEGGARITRKLITIGTPHRGSAKALEQLVNGVHKGVGKLSVDLTKFARSLPSLHQLLPEYAAIEGPEGLLKTTETLVPELKTANLADAMQFHRTLGAVRGNGYDLHGIVGFRQETVTTARIENGKISAHSTINGNDERGDGTVPRLSAAPKGLATSGATEQHVSLPAHQDVQDQLEFILTDNPVHHRSGAGEEQVEVSVKVDELVLHGEPVRIVIEAADERMQLHASFYDDQGNHQATADTFLKTGESATVDENLAPGAYTVKVQGWESARDIVAPVTASTLIWGDDG